MTTTQEQELFNRTAELLTDDKITPEQACSFIEKLRDAGIIADDILDPEPEQEQQKAFNEIAGILADWKITTEEACEVFVEWIEEWKSKKWKKLEDWPHAEKELAKSKAELTVIKETKMTRELNEILLKFGL